MSKVLLIGIPSGDKKKIEGYFKTVGVTCDVLPSIDAAIERIPDDPPSVILAEDPAVLEPLGGLAATLKTHAPTTSFVVMTNDDHASRALELMRAGAFDCVSRPYDRLQILAAAKRAALVKGRTLFAAKVEPAKNIGGMVTGFIVGLAIFLAVANYRLNGSPEYIQSLGSATLSGLQWEGRSLWVGNWYDSTVTQFRAKKNLFRKWRTFETAAIYRSQETQPILVCDTPEALVTVGFDLKMRTHQRGVGLPTLQTKAAPGSNPTGLAWDGSHLWSSDGLTGRIYKHGIDLTVLESVQSIIPQPTGLAYDGKSFWVLGGTPLRIAKMTLMNEGVIWDGPFALPNLLPAGISPSGVAVGFERLWWVSGGDPKLMSKSLEDCTRNPVGWKIKGGSHAN